MKAPISAFVFAGVALLLWPARGQDSSVTSTPLSPPAENTTAVTPANSATGPGGEPVLPSADFAPSRYEVLWTKSPFAVATPEAADENASPDYFLVGIAKVDGISYGSVIDHQSGEHFLISSDKANRGMQITAFSHSGDGSETYATVMKDGAPLTLKLQQAPIGGGPNGVPQMANGVVGNAPATLIPNIQAPGSDGMSNNGFHFPRIHRRMIHLPAPPEDSNGVAPPQPPAPPPSFPQR